MSLRALLMPAVLLISLLGGCAMPGGEDDGDGAEGPDTGSASVYVKDAPTDELEEFHIVIDEVRVHQAGTAEDGNGTDGADGNGPPLTPQQRGPNNLPTGEDEEPGRQSERGPGEVRREGEPLEGEPDDGANLDQVDTCQVGWITVFGGDAATPTAAPDDNATAGPTPTADPTPEDNATAGPTPDNATAGPTGGPTPEENATNGTVDVDLLAASDDLAALLVHAQLEACRYTQISMHLAETYAVENGTRVEVDAANEWVRVVRPWVVEEGNETRVVIDFDLDRSLHRTGGPEGGWRLTPVIGRVDVDVLVPDQVGSGEGYLPGEVVPLL